MDCPVCKKDSLRPHNLENDLRAYQCFTCQGIWLPSDRYFKWLKTQDDTPELPGDIAQIPVAEPPQARRSPDTGRVMRRFKIWPDQEFYLDRDELTQSVWLDHQEWEYLKSRNLHDNLHLFFMPLWQDKIRDEEIRQNFEQRYRERFGEADYARIKEAREWIYAHPLKNRLIAYLLDEDPYSV